MQWKMWCSSQGIGSSGHFPAQTCTIPTRTECTDPSRMTGQSLHHKYSYRLMMH